MRSKISVIIPTHEKDLNVLKKAIQSVLWADEVLVVDSSFSSRVKKIALKYQACYLAHKYIYSAKQKNWAIPQAKYDWILILDSDEIVTPRLRDTLRKLLNSAELKQHQGFGIARRHYFFGKFLRWGGRYPLYNVRLFRKNCRYEDRDVHAHIILGKKQVKNIEPKQGDILHYSDQNFDDFFERFNRYTSYQANYLQKIARKKITINWLDLCTNVYYFKAIAKDYWFFVPGTSLFRFIYMYFLKLGVLDGRHGFTIALFYSLQDYVSKNKYHLMVVSNEKSPIRIQVQQYLLKNIHLLSPILLKNQPSRKTLKNYLMLLRTKPEKQTSA